MNHNYFRFVLSIFLIILTVPLIASADVAVRSSGMYSDLIYGQAGGDTLRLDASIPEGEGPFPVALLVHGGGWIRGDRRDEISLLFEPLSQAGFVWFSVDYRLAPQSRWPACMEDVETAIGWVKTHAPEFRGDPSRIALIAYSAGGQISFSALMRGEEDLRVQVIVGLAPTTDLEQDLEKRGGLSIYLQALFDRPQIVTDESLAILRDASPINHVHPGLPPFLLIHGEEDQSVPIQQSRNLQSRLKENGVPCDLIVIPGAPHRIMDWDRYDPAFRDKMIGWLRRTLGQE